MLKYYILKSWDVPCYAEFDWDLIWFCYIRYKEKMDLFKVFPDGVDNPMIFKFDPAIMPIMSFAVSGDMDQAAIRAFAEDAVKNRLERIEVWHLLRYLVVLLENQIILHPEQLDGYNLSIAQVAQTLQLENLNLPGGKVYEGNTNLS